MVAKLTGSHLFSIVVPVWNPVLGELAAAIDSVFDQVDGDWQLVLVADGPQSVEVGGLLADAVRRAVGLVGDVVVFERGVQGGIVAASNDGLERCTGDFVAFLDNDDVLAVGALAAFREAVEEFDDVDVVYSDEDKLDPDGNRIDTFHKPGWSPERLRSQMYVGHLSAYRRSLVAEVGNLRPEFEGSQDHDLALRVTERARRVSHVPRVLYHWRQSLTSTAFDPGNKDWAFDAGVEAVQSQLDRLGMPAVAHRDRTRPGVVAVEPALVEFPLVSIIMLTGGSSRVVRGERVVMVLNAIESVVSRSSYPNYEIVVVVDRDSSDVLVDDVLRVGGGRVRVVQDVRPFSFSDSNNLGVSHAFGDCLVFLNDDTEVLTGNWLERLVLFGSVDGVGAVSCFLQYANGTVQHAGVVARNGQVGHRYIGYHSTDPGACEALGLTMNFAAVTAACLAVKRDAFEEVGGFCSQLPLAYNDVDFCFKLVNAGYRNVVDNRTHLMHFETSTRSPHIERWEYDFILERWGELMYADPWDNPNFPDGSFEELSAPIPLLDQREAIATGRLAARSWPLS